MVLLGELAWLIVALLVNLCSLRGVQATNVNFTLPPNDGSTNDPILQYRPHFVRSLPIQILLIGITITLVIILLVHLVFTASYHWALAPVNYSLQVSSVITLLISLIATLHVVLSATVAESMQWPFMLSYISVKVAPFGDEYNLAERVMWLIMNASTSGLAQLTHIHFLTLLFPSRLERSLIFFLLGPLAAAATVMQLLPIRGDHDLSLTASAIRNVCNATLSLLFTIFLFIWGLLVNRRSAWRTDGGTAIFGASALGLALASTGLTCLYVHREEEYVWLPGLMWSVVLWQSFFGWWWWVGSGGMSTAGFNGGNSVRERVRRAEKHERKRRGRFRTDVEQDPQERSERNLNSGTEGTPPIPMTLLLKGERRATASSRSASGALVGPDSGQSRGHVQGVTTAQGRKGYLWREPFKQWRLKETTSY